MLQTKISRSLNFLQYARKFLPLKALNLNYKGVVEPHLRYCCSVWGNHGESKKNILQKLQNCGARIVRNSSYDASASPLLSQLELPSIDEIINGKAALMVYKSINTLTPIYLWNLFTKRSSRDIITVRNSYTNLNAPFMNTKNDQKSLSYRVSHSCNGLKPTSKNMLLIFAFKRAIEQ